jgi:hypothetical protein
MTHQQRNKYMMLIAVLALLKISTVITAVIPAFAAVVARLQQIADDINTRANERNQSEAGTYDARDGAEEELLDTLDEVANALVAYASNDHLPDVREIAGIKRSKLDKMAKAELVLRADAIIALAIKYKQQIARYGAPAEKVDSLQPALDAFKGSMDAVATGASGRTGAVKTLKSMFNEADAVLKDSLDRMAATLQNSNPQFYASYKAARVIHDLGGSHTKNLPPVTPPVAAIPTK